MCPPFSFPLCVQKSILYISVSVPAQQKKVHQYCFSRFHIYALIYDIYFFLTYFTLYDRLQVHPPHYN